MSKHIIDADELRAEIDRRKIGYNTDGKHEAEYNTCMKVLDVISDLQREQSDGVNGVIHHALKSHWIVTDKNQLAAILKAFPEGAEVELFVCAKKEKNDK